MVKEDENDIIPIVLDVKNSTIFEDETKSKGKFMNRHTSLIDYFEIVGYKDEFDKIFIWLLLSLFTASDCEWMIELIKLLLVIDLYLQSNC